MIISLLSHCVFMFSDKFTQLHAQFKDESGIRFTQVCRGTHI